MENHEKSGVRAIRVRKLLAEAEASAESAVRTMRNTLAAAPPGTAMPLLEDAEHLFGMIEAADVRVELARADGEHAEEHAEDARSLARAAAAEAERRARKWARSMRS